jgi:hypothetical protein
MLRQPLMQQRLTQIIPNFVFKGISRGNLDVKAGTFFYRTYFLYGMLKSDKFYGAVQSFLENHVRIETKIKREVIFYIYSKFNS